jgi:hypothetical protein
VATGAEVEIDTGGKSAGNQFTCFTRTKVQILLRLETDTVGNAAQVLNLLALLAQKYKY